MQETVILFTLGSLSVTAYSLCAAAACLLACALCIFLLRREKETDAPGLCLFTVIGTFLGARLIYCAANLPQVLNDLGGPGFILQPWRGGFSLAGAALGCATSLLLFCRIRKADRRICAAAMLPSAFLALMILRLAEYFTTQGIGGYVEEGSALGFFPFAVMSEWMGCLTVPVFFWEALAALAGMLFCLCRRERKTTPRYAIGWLCVSQVLLESLRQDDCLRFGFVRFHQMAAALCLLGMLIWLLVTRHASLRERILRITALVLLAGIVIAVEFGLDKSDLSHVLLYAAMAVSLAGMFFTALFFPVKKKG